MRFSIIVPVYNAMSFLEACIGSVLAQTYADWELLLIDDGSTDGSGALIDSLAKRDSRIRVCHQENAGQFFARRVGIHKAKGEYLLFLDSDDTFTDDCLEKVDETLRRQPADIIMFAGSIIENGRDTGRRIGKVSSAEFTVSADWLRKKLIASHELNSLCLKAFRRNLFEGDRNDYGMFMGICCGEDKVQLLYPVTYAQSVGYLPANLYRYYRREDSTVHKFAIGTISRRIANGMYALLYQYMREWGMDGPEYQELVAVYYLRNYLSVYFGLRKRCTTPRERREFRRYPWEKDVSREAFRYRLSNKLTAKEKFKLLVARLHI